MKTLDIEEIRLLADETYETGATPEGIRAGLDAVGDGRAAFLARLAARAAVAGDDDSADQALADPSDATLAAAEAVYADRKSARKPPRTLASAPLWVAAADAFGGDMRFILKLAGAHVTPPGPRFLRDAADALGVALSMVRQHFDASRLPVGLAGAEMRSDVKPTTGGREDFHAALAKAEIPDALKRRWSAG